MSLPNLLNVYSGPDAVQKYFDPQLHPPLPLVELPQALNPYYDDGVRIWAKMMSAHPANNVKIMPAMNMLNDGVKPEQTKTVVEYSSGSTVISLALASRIYHGIEDVRAYLSNKTTTPKLRLMQFFGLDM
jgi:cysteine synthase